ncbi:peptidoglycan-binding protein [Streptomyces sp. CHD11]|uniref:peptidoglycan-binding protein n=1 Tax=Streptomyces sp. CHD11 TaxID=2741325 RepID=UPI001BFC3656|nr:peptidoglycan-binding protein [Streptomyces sp. CHD11]MBT3150785.1 peptidoglycan-binding protein [Streptomyces sp. CHD11]
MEQPNGNPCPECGAPRHRDNTPSCACTLRASDALRDARTAQAAAAEDFDPLRIRPYVELDGESTRGTPDGAAGRPGTVTPPDAGPSAEKPGTPPGAPSGTSPNTPPDASGAPGETMRLRTLPPEAAPGAADATSVLPAPLGAAATRPSATDLNLFDATQPIGRVPGAQGAEGHGPEGHGPDGHGPDGHGPDGRGPDGRGPDGRGPDGFEEAPPRRRRRGVLLAVAGAVITVVGAAGWASGMFSYETPSRDDAAPEDVRASVPDPSSYAPSAEPADGASPSAPPTSSAPVSESPSASASAPASPSPPASASASAGTSPSPSAPAEPSPAPEASSPAADTPGDTDEGDDDTAPVLRRGDRGPEVADLQQRLRQVYLYHDHIDGRFSHRVEEALRTYQWSRGVRDELGVYGPLTRARLEAET